MTVYVRAMRIALCVALLAACGSGGVGVDVKTDAGVVHGADIDGVMHWLGVPFAAPPVGALRWRAPQPVKPWSGTLATTDYQSPCPQTLNLGGPSYDEDCLYLNVWTPQGTHPGELPVMVWLHGGAFLFGSGGDKWYAGDTLAKRGFVIVTINYRLGAFGFFAHPALDTEDPAYPTSGNYGLEDQRAALQWVQKNIAAFGGDPKRVTLFGESAGGFSTCVQYLSSRTKGLFQAAISESGLCGSPVLAVPHATAQSEGLDLAGQLGCAGSGADALTCLRAVSTKDLLAKTGLPMPATQAPGGPFYQTSLLPNALPNVDGFVIAQPLADLAAAGGYAPRPLLLGTNQDEGTLFHSSLFAMPVADETAYRAALAVRFGSANVDAIVANYPVASFPSATRALAEVTGDAFFVCPTRRFARAVAAAGAPVFKYTFAHAPTQPLFDDLGVFHSSELPFVFGNDDYPLDKIGSAASLVDEIQSDWTHFATDHAPGSAWPAYDGPSDLEEVLDVTPSTATATKSALCDFWDGLGG